MKRMTDPMSAPPWPPTTLSIPDLWTRAKAMFGVLMREVKSVATLARTRHLSRRQRTDILCRLVPVEKIVRSLLVTEALIYLLMTPEGRRLLANTPKMPMPDAPPPVGVKKNSHKITISMPGWQTIAALQPRIDPRIVAPEPITPAEQPVPENLSRPFRVLGWIHPRPEEPPEKEKPRRRWISTFEDSNFPLPLKEPKKLPPPADPEFDSSAREIARRITALERVLANREPAIRRLAKYIASLPRDTLNPPSAFEIDTLWWWHGRPEYFNACNISRPAVRAFNKIEEPG
ncbi:MAG: hypothetical protein Q8R82_18235 [Hyphomonadaceae bacterium]|nr:hypothetical protein [Hyphomonadaceae bacterium]